MKIPVIHGYIDRRILVNFRVDADRIQAILPQPFRPKLYKGKAIAGICLIRLKQIKPKGFPDFLGISSENGAHRIAVEWEKEGEIKSGVYIPRRDTSNWFNGLAGGRFFPGVHHRADFTVAEEDGQFHVGFKSRGDDTRIGIKAEITDKLDPASIFSSLQEASRFFEEGSVGYSPNSKGFDCLKLHTYSWDVQPLKVHQVSSSFFENEELFPKGSVEFDNALLMREVEHEWRGA